jgi:hypothetical protein
MNVPIIPHARFPPCHRCVVNDSQKNQNEAAAAVLRAAAASARVRPLAAPSTRPAQPPLLLEAPLLGCLCLGLGPEQTTATTSSPSRSTSMASAARLATPLGRLHPYRHRRWAGPRRRRPWPRPPLHAVRP